MNRVMVLGLLSLLFLVNTVWCAVRAYGRHGWDDRGFTLFFALGCGNLALFLWAFSEALP